MELSLIDLNIQHSMDSGGTAMSIVFADDSLAATLDGANGPVSICTRQGRVIGYFSPAKPSQLTMEPPISDAEIRAIEAAGGGRPLKDILKDLNLDIES
jgi:hypothetical protein